MTTEPIHFTGKNFQAWENFDLEIEGLTVIVGPTDLGKSALYRGLKGIFRNEVGANHIRLGEAATELSLNVGEHSISSKRTKKGAITYVVDGVEFAKLNGAVPAAMEALGFGEIEIGDVTMDPMFSRQSDRQFLVDSDQSPQALNAILGGFASTERLDIGKKAGNLAVTNLNAEAKSLAFEIQQEQEQLEQLKPIQAAAEAISAFLLEAYTWYRTLDLSVTELSKLIASTKRKALLDLCLSKLTVPDTSPAESGLMHYRALQGLVVCTKRYGVVRTALNRIPVIDTTPMNTAIATIKAARIAHTSMKVRDRYIASAEKLKGIEEGFNDVVKSYKIRQAAINLIEVLKSERDSRLSEAKRSLVSTVEDAEVKLPKLQELAVRVSIIQQIKLTMVQHNKLTIELAELESALTAANHDSAELIRLQAEEMKQKIAQQEAEERKIALASIPHCPQCGEALPHLMEKHHA